MATDLSLAVMRVNSPYAEVMGRYTPKVSYDCDGVFYDKETNSFVYLQFTDNSLSEIEESHFVEVVNLLRPVQGLGYDIEEDKLHGLHESDFCGEADDFSCYLYFKYVDSPKEVSNVNNVRKVNFVKYAEDISQDYVNSLRRVSLSPTVRSFAEKHGLLSTVFKANEGRYACTSSMFAGFNNNPLGINMTAVSAISKSFNALANSLNKMFSGWHIYDSHAGYFVIQFLMWDEDGSTEYSKKFRYRLSYGAVMKGDFNYVEGYDDAIKTIEKNLPKVLASLQSVEIPVDLFEVCLAGASFSEEGWAGEDPLDAKSYLMSGELGYPENRTHVLTGVSCIVSRNDFTRHSALGTKTALLIVQ